MLESGERLTVAALLLNLTLLCRGSPHVPIWHLWWSFRVVIKRSSVILRVEFTVTNLSRIIHATALREPSIRRNMLLRLVARMYRWQEHAGPWIQTTEIHYVSTRWKVRINLGIAIQKIRAFFPSLSAETRCEQKTTSSLQRPIITVMTSSPFIMTSVLNNTLKCRTKCIPY
jgi:hypothetical protein